MIFTLKINTERKYDFKKKMFNGITQTLLEMLPMFIVLVLYWLRVECIKMTYLVAGVIDITNIKKNTLSY